MEEMEITFQINVFGIFLMTKIARPYLKCGSTIINTTSVTAYNGNEQLIDYSSIKCHCQFHALYGTSACVRRHPG